MGKMKELIAIAKDSHLEFFNLVFVFGLTIQSTVVTQMIEDKICLNQYGFRLADCADEHSDAKIAVLREASTISSYRSILSGLPAIVTTLFVGPWINNYPNHLKLIIVMPAISSILQVMFLTGNAIFFSLDPKTVLIVDLIPWIFGTIKGCFMALQTYIVLTTQPDKQILKFSMCDVASYIGGIAGQYTGGAIFAQKPWFKNQVSNYLGVFIVSLIFKISAKQAAKDPNHVNHGLPFRRHKSEEEKQSPVKEFVSKVFSFSAICKLFQTLTKPRESGKRGVLLFLVGIAVVRSVEYPFIRSNFYLFAQRAYGWSNYEYSKYSAINDSIPALMQLIGPRIFIQLLGMSDISLGILACVSHAGEMIIRGIWLTTVAFFISTVTGCTYTLIDAVTNSLLGKIVERDEIGGTFSLISVISSAIALFSDWSLTQIFNATLHSDPGFCFQLFAGITIIPISVFLWINYKRSHLIEAKSNETNKDVNSPNK
uniref:Major facilitator superfamily (MFS) profile domain-containing protein n=1 Tax=Tetranychus urticae TaxID=32264 RepID=T1KP27_TETUR